MASRRKYRSKINVAVAAPELPPPEQPQSAPADDDALVRAAAATQHAESLQHQHMQRQQAGLAEPELTPEQRQAIDAHIDGFPSLTEHQKRFLKSHPSLLHEPYLSLMRHAIMIARHAGIPDDTPQMDHAILAGIARDLDHHHALSQIARPTEANAHHDVGQAADAPQHEAEQHLAAMGAENPPSPRRSIPVSAPVSRDPWMASGHRQVASGKITLSKDEVEIAHNSRADLPPLEAEKLYIAGKKQMLARKAAGTYESK
jgi:hypothetical protein